MAYFLLRLKILATSAYGDEVDELIEAVPTCEYKVFLEKLSKAKERRHSALMDRKTEVIQASILSAARSVDVEKSMVIHAVLYYLVGNNGSKYTLESVLIFAAKTRVFHTFRTWQFARIMPQH